ncbi:MAG: MFS transporter [Candidatus Micrarchaeota archaeon]
MNKRIRTLLIVDLALLVSINLFGPIYAIFAEGIGGDILAVGESWGAFAIATGIFIILFGKIEEKRRKINMLILSYLLYIIGFTLYLFVSNIFQLILVQILLGLALAVNIPAWDTLFTVYMDTGKESSTWGLYSGMTYIISGITAAIGSFIVFTYSFEALFYVMIAVAVLGACYAVYVAKTIDWGYPPGFKKTKFKKSKWPW